MCKSHGVNATRVNACESWYAARVITYWQTGYVSVRAFSKCCYHSHITRQKVYIEFNTTEHNKIPFSPEILTINDMVWAI